MLNTIYDNLKNKNNNFNTICSKCMINSEHDFSPPNSTNLENSICFVIHILKIHNIEKNVLAYHNIIRVKYLYI